MATSNMSAWQKEAEEEAKRYSEQIKADNQQILDTLTNAKNNALQQLQTQQDNAIYNINTNKSTINANAENNAKQLYINKLLALKSNEAAMKRAGLGTQGIVGSQVNSINNNYGTNLSSVLNQKSSDLQELEKQKNDTLLNYSNSRVDLTNQYDTNYSNALASINDKALSQYNTIYNSYLAMKQQQYENEQAELARQEQIRQFNEQMALERASLYNSYSGGVNDLAFNNQGEEDITIVTNNYNGKMNAYQKVALARYGAFNTVDKNGNVYQPKGVVYNGKDYGVLSSTGKTVGQATGNSKYSSSTGLNVAGQTLWQTKNGQYWYWNGNTMSYEPIVINNTGSAQKSSSTTTSNVYQRRNGRGLTY